MGKRYDIFISYNEHEADYAHRVKAALEQKQIRCFLAPDDIPDDQSYDDAVPKAIAASKAMVLVFSSNAQNSDYVFSELKLAHQHNKFIIPFAVEDCEFSDRFYYYLSNSQRIRAFEEKNEAMDNLVDDTRKAIGKMNDRQKKRLRTGLIAVAAALVLAMIGGVVYYLVAGTVGGVTGDCSWSYNQFTKELRIYGNGSTESYESVMGSLDAGWHPYCTKIEKLTVEEGVERIGDYCLVGVGAEEISLPVSLLIIGDYGLSGQPAEQIVLPEHLESIGNAALSSCMNITEIALPESLQFIGNDAFSGCTKLKSIAIPDRVTYIGTYAFQGCTALEQVKLSSDLVWITDSCFGDCTSLAEITIPEGVLNLDWNAFKGCTSLKTVTLPSTLEEIGREVFEGCTSLTEITIPESVTMIDNLAFLDSGLTDIYILNSDLPLRDECIGFRTNSEGKYVEVDDMTIHAKNSLSAKIYVKLHGFRYKEIED